MSSGESDILGCIIMIMTQVPWIITYTMITTCWLVVCLPYTAVVVWLSVSKLLGGGSRMS